MVEKYEHSPHMELERRVYPNYPDKDDYLAPFLRFWFSEGQS